MTAALVRPRLARRRLSSLRAGDTVHFVGGNSAVVNGIGDPYDILTRTYHLVTLTDTVTRVTRQAAYARVSFWDVEVSD
jgi:hypothetical protein